MDKDLQVPPSTTWNGLKRIFRKLDLDMGIEPSHHVITSHGILIIVNGEALFLRQKVTYEYRSIVHGLYSGGKLYHYLSLVTKLERSLLLKHPFEQWRYLYPESNMPGVLYRKLRALQKHISDLLAMIPPMYHQYDNMLTIPKGQVMGDESSTDAAIRELHEETGICLTSHDLCDMYMDISIGTDSNTYVTYVYAVYMSEKPQICVEGMFQGYTWQSLDSHILRPRYKRILKKFLHYLNESRSQRMQESVVRDQEMV